MPKKEKQAACGAPQMGLARAIRTLRKGRKTLLKRDDIVFIIEIPHFKGGVVCLLPDGHHSVGLHLEDFELFSEDAAEFFSF